MILHNMIYLCLVLNVVALIRKKRIIGGEDVDISEYPHQVSVRLFDTRKHYCGGAIIKSDLILSAAHCYYGKDAYIPRTKVYAGTTNSRDYSVEGFGIVQVHIHPNFTGQLILTSMYQHDIAILELDGYISFDSNKQKVSLPRKNVSPGNVGDVTGWGLTSYPRGRTSDILQKASMTVMSNRDCQRINPIALDKGQFCAFDNVGVGVCTHDSGGPLTRNGVIIGIVSFNVPCATNLPDVYTNVYNYLPYINSIMT